MATTIVLSDSALKMGETSQVTITFSAVVGNLPLAALNVSNGTLAGLASADGGLTWTATLTPQGGVTAASNVITLDNTMVGGTGTTTSANYAIDTVAPTVSFSMSDLDLRAGETATVTLSFSEAVTGVSSANFSINGGTLSTLTSSDGGISWSGTFTPSEGVNSPSQSVGFNPTGVTDLAGNLSGGLPGLNYYAINTVRPTATIGISDAALTTGETAVVSIRFSEAVIGFGLEDLLAENGVLSGLSSSDGINWIATFTPNADVADTSNVITLLASGVTNAAGNAGSGTVTSPNYTIDTAPPKGFITLSDTALKIGESATVTITFNKPVTGLTNALLNVDAAGTLSPLTSSDGGLTWTATFMPSAAVTAATNLITFDNRGVTDAGGQAGVGISASGNFTIDTVAPTVSFSMSDTDIKAGETATVTLSFSEAVTGLSNANLALGGTLSTLTTSNGGISWSATFTPSEGVNTPNQIVGFNSTGITDLAGNTMSSGLPINYYSINTVRPTATVGISDAALTTGETAVVSIRFSEAVVGFGLEDLQAENGVLSGLSSSDGINWTATFTPNADVADTSNMITLLAGGVTNAAGNAGSGTVTSPNYTIDTVRPKGVITLSDSALTVGETATVTIKFNMPVTGLTLAAFTVENGTLSNLSSADGITWSATFTPAAGVRDTSNVITLDNSRVTDAFGHAGTSTTQSANYTVNTGTPLPEPEEPEGPDAPLFIFRGDGEDVLHGGGGNDTLGGGGGNDQIFGHDGDDIFIGGPGNDFINGGSGRDIVQLVGGSRDDYTLRMADGKLVITHRNGGEDGTDTVINIEVLRFTGATPSLGVDGTLARLYEALFDRAIDLSSKQHWLAKAAAGMSLHDIAQAILDASEAQQPGGALDNDAFVGRLYAAAFGRAVDAAGRAFWVDQLHSGALDRASVALAIADSAEKLALDAARPVDIDLDTTDVASLIRLYDTGFDRVPDEAGINYWIGQSENGVALKDIAAALLTSGEGQLLYGGLSNEAFVAALFENHLDRTGKPEEVQEWVRLLDSGAATRGDVLLGIAESAEKVALVGVMSTAFDFI